MQALSHTEDTHKTRRRADRQQAKVQNKDKARLWYLPFPDITSTPRKKKQPPSVACLVPHITAPLNMTIISSLLRFYWSPSHQTRNSSVDDVWSQRQRLRDLKGCEQTLFLYYNKEKTCKICWCSSMRHHGQLMHVADGEQLVRDTQT